MSIKKIESISFEDKYDVCLFVWFKEGQITTIHPEAVLTHDDSGGIPLRPDRRPINGSGSFYSVQRKNRWYVMLCYAGRKMDSAIGWSDDLELASRLVDIGNKIMLGRLSPKREDLYEEDYLRSCSH